MKRSHRVLVPVALALLQACLIPTASAQCTLAADLMPGAASSVPIEMKAAFGNTLYLTSRFSPVGVEPYVWNEGSGVTLLADIRANGSSSPRHFEECCTAFGSLVFFSASDGTHGTELWVTNGTGAGTYMLTDIRNGSRSSSPAKMTRCGNRVFFTANDGIHGTELWVSDGTCLWHLHGQGHPPGIELIVSERSLLRRRIACSSLPMTPSSVMSCSYRTAR